MKARVYWFALALVIACEVPLVVHQDEVAAGGNAGGAAAGTGTDAGAAGRDGGGAGDSTRGGAGGAGEAGAPGLIECERPLIAWQVSAGEDHACASEYLGGAMYCWGLGTSGQLGTGLFESSTTPSRVDSDLMFNEVKVAAKATCARTHSSQLYCFGDNQGGMLADGTDVSRARPVLIANQVAYFGAGASYAIMRKNDGVFAWGKNTDGQLGLGDATLGMTLRSPTFVGQLDVGSLSAGALHLCSIDFLSYYASCAGSNDGSRLGLPGSQRSLLTEVSQRQLKNVSAGHDRTCTVTRLDTLECWGRNQPVTFLGQPDVVPSPKRIGTDSDWDQVSVGYDHICATTLDGRLLCVGDNSDDELGQPGMAQPSFVEPMPGLRFTGVSAGHNFTCALREPDRAVVCFGSNEHGKLGRASDSQVWRSPELVCLPPP